jgi:hypothetical protein
MCNGMRKFRARFLIFARFSVFVGYIFYTILQNVCVVIQVTLKFIAVLSFTLAH